MASSKWGRFGADAPDPPGDAPPPDKRWGRFGPEAPVAPSAAPTLSPSSQRFPTPRWQEQPQEERTRVPSPRPASPLLRRGPNEQPASLGRRAAVEPGAASPSNQQDQEIQEITRQVAEWDSEMDSLDRKQEQLLNDQWRLLRTQIGSLMGALSEMRAEMNELKGNVVGKEMEAVIEKMVAAHDGHDQTHSSMASRVAFLEDFVGESVDKHAAAHNATLESRLEYIEGLIGDSAEKHSTELEAARAKLEDMNKAIAACAKSEHHSSMEERMEYLENFLGESADKHAKDLAEHKDAQSEHKTTMETRLEYLEGLLGDSSDKHAKEIEAAKNKLGELHEAITSCAKTDHHSSLEQRVGYLENFLGESADKHEKELADHKNAHSEHKTTMETRLEYLEGLLGDSADKHSKEIEAANSKLGELHNAISACAKSDHHSSLEQRVDYLENFLGESADKHEKDLADHKNAHLEHKATMENRLEYLERLLGDSADKHANQLAEHKTATERRLDKLESVVSVQQESLKARLSELETAVKVTSEKRIGALESKLTVEIETWLSDINTKHSDMDAMIKQCSKIDHNSALERRVASLADVQSKDSEAAKAKLSDLKAVLDKHEEQLDLSERRTLDGNENNARRLATLEAGHLKLKSLTDELGSIFRVEKSTRDAGLEKMDDRLAQVEHAVNVPVDRRLKDLELMQGKLRDLHAKFDQQRTVIESHRSGIDQRLAQIEITVDGSHGIELMREVDQRIQYLQEDEKRARDMVESSVKEQIRLEHSAILSQASQIKEQWDREMKARQAHMDSFKELLGQERSGREFIEASLDKRIDMCERRLDIAPPPRPQIVTAPVVGTIRGNSAVVPGAMSPRMSAGSPRVPAYAIAQPQAVTTIQSTPPSSVVRMTSVGNLSVPSTTGWLS